MDIDDLPSYESKRFVRNQDRDYDPIPFPYNRMHRFLMSQKGQKIDDVFSEYMHSSWVPTAYRTEKHFNWYVETHTFVGEDGGVWYNARYWHFPRSVAEENSKNFFYVDPKTKNLVYKPKVKGKKYYRKREDVNSDTLTLLGDGEQLQKVKGIWYRFTFDVDNYDWTIVKNESGIYVRRMIQLPEEKRKKLLNSRINFETRFHYTNLKIAQLSHKELKNYKLKND